SINNSVLKSCLLFYVNERFLFKVSQELLLVLMSVFSKSFLTLVRSDLMSFSFFTARHNSMFLRFKIILKSLQIVVNSSDDLGIIGHFTHHLKLFFCFVFLLRF